MRQFAVLILFFVVLVGASGISGVGAQSVSTDVSAFSDSEYVADNAPDGDFGTILSETIDPDDEEDEEEEEDDEEDEEDEDDEEDEEDEEDDDDEEDSEEDDEDDEEDEEDDEDEEEDEEEEKDEREDENEEEENKDEENEDGEDEGGDEKRDGDDENENEDGDEENEEEDDEEDGDDRDENEDGEDEEDEDEENEDEDEEDGEEENENEDDEEDEESEDGEDSEEEKKESVSELSTLEIGDQDNDATITEGDSVDVSVSVENDGNVAGSFDVTLQIGNALELIETTAELDTGETETVVFPAVTSGLEPDEYTVAISTDDDTVTGALAVEAEEEKQAVSDLSDLHIAGQQRDSVTITNGDEGDISVVVENVGNVAGSFDVTVQVGDALEQTRTTGELAVDETATITFAEATGSLASGGYIVEASTDNDSVTGTLGVQPEADDEADQEDDSTDGDQERDERQAEWEIVAASLSNTELTPGENLQVGLQVEHDANTDRTFDTELLIDGVIVDSESVTVEAGETGAIEFEHQFDDPGEYEIGVGDRSLATVSVTPADEDGSGADQTGDDTTSIEVTGATVSADWVRDGYEASVRVTVENTADRTADRTLAVTVEGETVATETVTLQPNERETVTLEFEAVSGSVTVDGVEAGWLDTSENYGGDIPEDDDDADGTGAWLEFVLTGFILLLGVFSGLAVLKPQVLADDS